jgi:hypothetical protein
MSATRVDGIGRARRWSHRQAMEYSDGADRPLGGYLALMSIYSTATLGAAGLARALRRPAPERLSPWDVAQLGVATHKLSRLVTKDPVTSPLRAPFTRYTGLSAPGELEEEVRAKDGLSHSVGELLTCPMCFAQWVATALCAGLVIAPRTTRLALATFTAVAGADFLQHVYVALQQTTEEQGSS